MEGLSALLLLPVPELAGPIGRAGEKDIAPEWVATHLINRPRVPEVRVEILFHIGLAATVHRGFLCGSKVHVCLVLYEIETETGCCPEIHPLLYRVLLRRRGYLL